MGVRLRVQSLWTKADASTFVYEFAQSRIVIGRSRSADVQLPHRAVSGAHATICAEGAGYVLIDQGSTNGTRINEVLLVAGRPKPLRPNDVVDLGGYRITIEVGVPVAQTMSARLTTDFAHRMLAEQAGRAHDGDFGSALLEIQEEADERVDLLPIPEEHREPVSEPPPERRSAPSRPSRPRSSRPVSEPPIRVPMRLGRSEVAVYMLAAVVVAVSAVAMVLLATR